MDTPGISLFESIHSFLGSPGVNLKARNTRRGYRRTLDVLMQATSANLPVASVTKKDIERCLLLLEQGRGQAALNIDRSNLRTFLSYCQDEGWIAANPAATFRRVKIKDRRRLDGLKLDEDQVEQLLKEADRQHPRDLMAISLGLFAGMRDSEIVRLQWADVSWARREIAWIRPKIGDRYVCPFNDDLSLRLTPYYDWYRQTYGPVDPHWYVIPLRGKFAPFRLQPDKVDGAMRWLRDQNGPMSRDWALYPQHRAKTLLPVIKKLLARIGVEEQPGQGMHMLRRTFAWNLLQATGNIRLVMTALGHQHQSTTEAYLFRTDETNQLREAYQADGFRLWARPETTTAPNVIDIASRRRVG